MDIVEMLRTCGDCTSDLAADEIEKLQTKIKLALALTDTGSPEFKAAWEGSDAVRFPSGWCIVEKIREVLR